MKKGLLTMFLLGAVALSGNAVVATADYTYADGDLFAFGANRKETLNVAMGINDPSLVGLKITGFRAYVNGTSNYSAPSLWMTKVLTVANKANSPDICSYDVNIKSAGSYGVMEVTLDEPYLITNDPVYLGYTITVDELTTQTGAPIILSESNNTNGFWIYSTKTYLKWLNKAEDVGGVAYIVAQIEGDYPENSLGLADYETIYAEAGKPFDATFKVTNIGANPVTSIKYKYSINGSAETVESVTLPSSVMPNLSVTSPITLTFPGIDQIGTSTLNLTIMEVNGQENMSVAPSIAANVNVIPYKPVRRPLIEEYTGLWCGWCPGGFVAMEKIEETLGDSQVSICYHSDDEMCTSENFPMVVSGFPNSSLDRLDLDSPFNFQSTGSGQEFTLIIDARKRMELLTDAAIDVYAYIDANNTLKVRSKTMFIRNIEDAKYRVGYALVCDGMTNKSWSQHNYFAGNAAYLGTPVAELVSWPMDVTGLVYNDVAVEIKTVRGIENSLPSNIELAKEYVNEYSIDLNNIKQYKTGLPLLIASNNYKPENLKICAFVINTTTGEVINANKYRIDPNDDGSAGVDSISKDALEVVAKEYYDLSGRKVMNPVKGIYILREKLSDGSFNTKKVML